MNIVEYWAITTIIAIVFGLIIIAITCGLIMKKKIDKNPALCYNNNVERHNKQKEEGTNNDERF